jgi:hypothetical protein
LDVQGDRCLVGERKARRESPLIDIQQPMRRLTGGEHGLDAAGEIGERAVTCGRQRLFASERAADRQSPATGDRYATEDD